MRQRLCILVSLLVLLVVAPLGNAQEDRLQIVAGHSILADVVSNVAGDVADVVSMIPVGADPHTFEPVPSDLVALAEADIVFINGAFFEEALLEAIENASDDMNLVEASSCVDIIPFGLADAHAHEGEDDHAHEGDDDHAHEGDDDHAHEGDDDHAHEGDDDHAHEGDDDHAHEGDDDHAHEDSDSMSGDMSALCDSHEAELAALHSDEMGEHSEDDHAHEDGEEHSDDMSAEATEAPSDDDHAHEDGDDDHAHEGDDDHMHEDGHDHAHGKAEALGSLYALECDHGHGHGHEGEEEHSDEEHSEDDHSDEHGHAHGEGSCDSHVWMAPQNVMHWTLLIRDTLIELDPANAETYTANASAYILELDALLEDFIEPMVATVPEENRILVTNHETLGYFAVNFDFDVVGTVIPQNETGGEPSTADIAALIDEIREVGVPAVFAETTLNTRIVQQIADETGASLEILFTDSLSDADGPATTYLEYMRYNVTTIVEALGGGM